jgi:ribonuclease P protein subunit POP4
MEMIDGKCYKITKENILGHEMIGLEIKVINSTDPFKIGTKGIVVDETQNTFVIIDREKEKILAKKECEFEFNLNGEKVIVKGKEILKRSEDRVKEFRN